MTLISKINEEPSSKTIIIGIDHGYGNIKTANFCFRAGVAAYEQEPTFKNNLLIYDSRYYVIGDEHKEFTADKMRDLDYYVLTLAAIAQELHMRKTYHARVHLAVGLPLSWVARQKVAFKAYLMQNEHVDFSFRGKEYSVTFAGADVFPQGFAAVAHKVQSFNGVNMLADIGNGTMNIMYINDGRPLEKRCYTEKFGTYQCTLAVREQLLRLYGTVIEDSLIERVIRFGNADISEKYLDAIQKTAAEYVAGIFRRLREHEYDPERMRLYVVGGGGCMIKNFGSYDPERVMILDDIRATARGYEYLAEMTARRNGRAI